MREKTFMIATLVIPSAEGATQTFNLSLESRDGRNVFVSSHGHVIKGPYFRFVRDRMGARIETDEVPLVAKVLGVPENEPGLVTKT